MDLEVVGEKKSNLFKSETISFLSYLGVTFHCKIAVWTTATKKKKVNNCSDLQNYLVLRLTLKLLKTCTEISGFHLHTYLPLHVLFFLPELPYFLRSTYFSRFSLTITFPREVPPDSQGSISCSSNELCIPFTLLCNILFLNLLFFFTRLWASPK